MLLKFFNINDKYTYKRLETLFKHEDKNYTLITFYIENKYKTSGVTIDKNKIY